MGDAVGAASGSGGQQHLETRVEERGMEDVAVGAQRIGERDFAQRFVVASADFPHAAKRGTVVKTHAGETRVAGLHIHRLRET